MCEKGNKIHIFSVEDFQLKHCLGENIQINRIMNFGFSKKNKFLSFFYDDLSIQIYNLINVNENNKTICTCQKDDSKKSFLGSMFSSIKVDFFLNLEHYL